MKNALTTLRAFLLFAVAVLAWTPSAWSEPPGISITSAVADAASNTLTITGVNFAASNAVKLGDYPALHVVSSSATSIVALLPAGIAPGTYLLSIAPMNGSEAVYDFVVTIAGK